jgi:hypothetical protein
MTNEVNKDWSHWLKEDDDTAVTARLGAQAARQDKVKYGGKTPVSVAPKTVEQTPDQAKSPFEVGKSYDKSDDPVRNRPSSVDYPQQNGPTNPQQRFIERWKEGGDLLKSTREAQRRQNPNRKGYPWG